MGKPEIGTTVVVDVPATTANLGPGFDCLGAALDLNNQFQLKAVCWVTLYHQKTLLFAEKIV